MARIEIAPGEGEESTRLFQPRPELGAAMTALSRRSWSTVSCPCANAKSCACASPKSINVPFDWTPALHRRCRTVLTEEVYAQVSSYRESPLYTDRERAAIDFADITSDS